MIPSSMVKIKRATFHYNLEYFRTAAGMTPEDAVARSFLENSFSFFFSLLLIGLFIYCKFFYLVLSYNYHV